MPKIKKPMSALARAKKAERAAASARRQAEQKEAARQLKRMNKKPRCVECLSWNVRMGTGAEIYPHRPDLFDLQYWICECGAYCGCHKGTDYTPLGRPAGPATRKAREAAHAAFDPLWKRVAERDNLNAGHARNRGYRFLAGQLGIERADCHISHMDAVRCGQVVAICEAVRRGEIRRREREPGEEG